MEYSGRDESGPSGPVSPSLREMQQIETISSKRGVLRISQIRKKASCFCWNDLKPGGLRKANFLEKGKKWKVSGPFGNKQKNIHQK